MSYARPIALTSLAMLAFAGNSLLCRLALEQTAIDPASFTTIRLLSGALTLWLVVRTRGGTQAGRGNWLSALALFAYAAGFSFAYVSLPAATGARSGALTLRGVEGVAIQYAKCCRPMPWPVLVLKDIVTVKTVPPAKPTGFSKLNAAAWSLPN